MHTSLPWERSEASFESSCRCRGETVSLGSGERSAVRALLCDPRLTTSEGRGCVCVCGARPCHCRPGLGTAPPLRRRLPGRHALSNRRGWEMTAALLIDVFPLSDALLRIRRAEAALLCRSTQETGFRAPASSFSETWRATPPN
ncbi:hypothetical protein AAFF_G00006550 [Aldrovandia affinis]|uniref:Uncharacterized protein n=1 Tax=Aldrovandia affinis TaxID=143900 RepID=A0AAD7X318_9TELE|nr:hypothetical protein AAFF_G00006550 [Aldrovandia affinis]